MNPFMPFILAAPAVVTVADDTDAAAYFAVLTTAPSNPERAKVNATTKALKDAGVFAGLDWWAFLAAETAQASRVNLRKPSKLLAPTNGPTFQANVGWVGDGVSAYLDFGELYQATGNQFSQNSHTLGGVTVATGAATGSRPLLGNFQFNPKTSIGVSPTGAGTGFRSADSSDTSFNVAATGNRNGHFAFTRTTSTIKRGFFNGTKTVEASVTTNGLNGANGSTHHSQTAYTDDTIGLIYSGAGFTDAQMVAIHTIVRDQYLGPKGLLPQ